MIPIIYIISLEAIICGYMLNRTLCAKSRRMWHMTFYVIIKTIICSLAVHFKLLLTVTPLCIVISFIYALVCFDDKFSQKLLATIAGIGSLAFSNICKFAILHHFGLSQNYSPENDELARLSVIVFSILVFCSITITATNIICKVRAKIVTAITLVNILLLVAEAIFFIYVHSLTHKYVNGIYSVFILFAALPAIILLYFSESIVFSHKDDYFRD